jgi:branched-chain amino acid transport system substrate-binding protein
MRAKSRLSVGVAVTVLGLMTACSSSKDSASNAGGTGPKPTKSTIQIGMIVAESGSNGTASAPSADVGAAWAKWVNKDLGGINGHPVEVNVINSRGDTATAGSGASELVNDKKIIAAVGSQDAGTDVVWTKVFTDAKVPVIGGSIIADKVASSSPYVFAINPPVSVMSKLTVDAAKRAGATKVSAVVCAEVPQCAQAAVLWEPRAKADGLAWGGLTQVLAADPSYTAPCLSLKKSGGDFVILGLTPQVLTRFVKDCSRQNITFPSYALIAASIDASKMTPISKADPSSFSLAMSGVQWWLDTPAVKQYRDVMMKYGKSDTFAPNQNQSVTWASFEMFRKVMANASDNPTSAEVETAMDSVKNEDLDGLLAQKISFTAGQPSTPMKCMFQGTLKNGVFTGSDKVCLDS